MKLLIFTLLGLLSFSVFAEIKSEDALKYVPGGTIVKLKKDEAKVKTPNGGVVELEFKRNGELDEASGDMAEADTFIPGADYLPLEKITQAVKKQGYQLRGDWTYEKGFMKDWRYEVDVFHENREAELVVDAKNGKVLDRRND